jgi:probable F420-dependent oxidoreductase
VGFDALWVCEHLLTAPGLYGASWLSPLLCLAHMAAVTSRIRLGTNILIPAMRNPVMLAKEIATIDALAGGRYILGLGLGWDAHEFEVCGTKLSERGGRTDETIIILRHLLTESRVSYHGRYYQFEDVTIDPRPPRFPPLWMAGGSKIKTSLSPDAAQIAPAVLRRISQANGWIARAAGDQQMVKADWQQITAYCASIGRDPATLTFAHLNFLHLVPSASHNRALQVQQPYFERVMGAHRSWELLQRSYFTGTSAEIVARIQELAAAGLQHMVLCPLDYDLEQLDLYASEILPYFR